MTYFISDQDSTKGKDSIYQHYKWHTQQKGKSSVNILISNYPNKHIMFNKREYVGHLEPTIEEIPQTTENQDPPTMHSITTERMTAEKVEPDTFKPPCHKLKQHIETKLTELLKVYDMTLSLHKMKLPFEPHL